MSLYAPYFLIKQTEDGCRICHNCDGGISFTATEDIPEKIVRFVLLAIEEGKRQKSREILQCLGITK